MSWPGEIFDNFSIKSDRQLIDWSETIYWQGGSISWLSKNYKHFLKNFLVRPQSSSIGSPPEDAKNYVIDHTNCMLRSAKPKLDPVYNIKFSHSLGNRKKPAVK